ncbi:MAG: hypothetical protein NT062_09140 [Proteobacteria bacterium]|nr:hypothetical protein [Pseudomonadota bacterium]
MIKAAAMLVVISGCYFYYPDLPKTTVKPIEGATIELKTRDHTDWYPCGESDKDCELHDGKLRRADSYVILSANYEGKKLSQADFRALADPEYPKRIQQIEAKKGTCRLSLVPSVIAAIGILAETVVVAGSSQFGDRTLPLALISGGVAIGGAALSYPLGGYACRAAGKLAEPLHLDYGDEIYVRPDRTALAEEMQSLTATFNARLHGPAAPDPTETPGTDAPDPGTTDDADEQPK